MVMVWIELEFVGMATSRAVEEGRVRFGRVFLLLRRVIGWILVDAGPFTAAACRGKTEVARVKVLERDAGGNACRVHGEGGESESRSCDLAVEEERVEWPVPGFDCNLGTKLK